MNRLLISLRTFELGHVKSRDSNAVFNTQVERERWAWDWARRNGIMWMPRMERYAVSSFQSYERAKPQV
jgi:hypothetical protein